MNWTFNTKPDRKYKCRICKCEVQYIHSYCDDCRKNRKSDIEKYEQKLKDKRKYYQGEKITSIEEFERQKFVYWHGVIRHREFIRSMQYRTVIQLVLNGGLYKAIKKDGVNG